MPIFIIALERLITSLDFLNREDPSYTIETLENDTISFIDNFEFISHLSVVFLLLTLNKLVGLSSPLC